MGNGDVGQGAECDERAGILVAVVVRGFHEGALGIESTQAEIDADWREQVAKDAASGGMKCNHKEIMSKL